MFANIVGILTGAAVFFIYFGLLGSDPAMETLIGLLLSVGAGAWAWWMTTRRQRAMDDPEFRRKSPKDRT